MSENKKYKSDIEIAREAKLQNILEVAKKKLNIEEKFLEPYGHYKAKLSFDYINSLDKLIKDRKIIYITTAIILFVSIIIIL